MHPFFLISPTTVQFNLVSVVSYPSKTSGFHDTQLL